MMTNRSAKLNPHRTRALVCDTKYNYFDCLIASVVTAMETTDPLQKGTLIRWTVDWRNEKLGYECRSRQ